MENWYCKLKSTHFVQSNSLSKFLKSSSQSCAFRGDFSAPSKNQFFWIFETLNVSYSGLNQPILACNTSFPLKIKCSFIWNRFQPGKKSSGKIPGKIRFFGIFVTGCIPKEGSNYTFLDSPDSSGSKNTKFSAVEIFGYLILLWSCCGVSLSLIRPKTA